MGVFLLRGLLHWMSARRLARRWNWTGRAGTCSEKQRVMLPRDLQKIAHGGGKPAVHKPTVPLIEVRREIIRA
jgi:hypothetical protein